MAIVIEQKPKYKLLPVGQQIIHTVYDATVISGSNFKIKYIAEIYVSNVGANVMSTANRVAVVKVNPNNTGRGIFDLNPILENYVSPDYEGGFINQADQANMSTYNTNAYSSATPHNIHQIDNFTTNKNSVRYVRIKFKVEFATSATGAVTVNSGNEQDSDKLLIFNGMLYETDVLNLDSSNNFGYNLDYYNFILRNSNGTFLSNAPTTQYLRDTDYLTLPFFTEIDYSETGITEVGTSSATNPAIKFVKFQFYYNGSTTGSLISKQVNAANGGHYGYQTEANNRIQYVGAGTGNLVGSGETLPANWDYYTVEAYDDTDTVVSATYKLYKQDEDCKGYETIRLTWLNKWGTWDYYNFTKKSIRKINTKRKTFTQITGTWNESVFRLNGHQGGNKTYNSSITESITLNTDYISEANAIWLEELFISNEVYKINKRSTDDSGQGYMRKYIEPVVLKTSTHTRKTKANDRLIQYTFEIETTKTKKSQRI